MPEAEQVVETVTRLGHWCEGCMTASAIEVDVVTMDDGGADVVVTLEGCRKCRTGVCRDESR